jgi:hypothetical protein
MSWLFKKTPNKWKVLAEEIIANKNLVVEKELDNYGKETWYAFNYNGHPYRIRYSGNSNDTYFQFEIYSNERRRFIESHDFFSNRLINKLGYHITSLERLAEKKARMKLVEDEVFKKESHEST